MRLLKLKVKNIASLKGEHTVDFEDIQSRSHLFAITGETGAGKSSLLNSIGLALYGKVFKSNVIQNDLVTLGEKEGQIELIFEVKGKHYLAFWRARVLKANGEAYATAQSPVRELYELAGTEFSSQRNISTSKVEDILNLDFDQFCKCIILNQGEFARFLLSTFNERKEILEKLYPGEVLENVTKELKAQSEALTQEISQIHDRCKTLQGESGPTEDLKEKAGAFEEKLKIYESWSALMEKIHKHFSSSQTYHQNHADYQRKKLLTQQEYAQETTHYNLILKKSGEAASLMALSRDELEKRQPRLQELLQLEVKLLHQQKEKEAAAKELKLLLDKIDSQKAQHLKLTEALTQHQQRLSEIEKECVHPLEELLLHRKELPDLFELWHAKNQLQQEISLLESNFNDLEIKGKETSSLYESLEKELSHIPADSETKLVQLKKEKEDLTVALQKRQKAEVQLQETRENIQKLSEEILQLDKKEAELKEKISFTEKEMLPLQTSLKLQEILTAVKICLNHEESKSRGECPVCAHPVSPEKWDELALLSARNDFAAMEAKLEEYKILMVKSGEEQRIVHERAKTLLLSLNEKKSMMEKLELAIQTPLTEAAELDMKISEAQKNVWDKEKLLKDKTRIEQELSKCRSAYKELRDNIQKKKTAMESCLSQLQKIQESWRTLLPQGLSDEALKALKSDSKLISGYLDIDQQLQKVRQELQFLETNHKDNEARFSALNELNVKLSESIQALRNEIFNEVQEEGPAAVLERLRLKLKEHQGSHQKLEEELKLYQNKLKEFQSRLYAYDEQIKDCEVVFARELQEVRFLSHHHLPLLNQDVQSLTLKLTTLSLGLSDMSELFIPIRDLLEKENDNLKQLTNTTRSELAAVKARLEDWEKRQDKIKLLELTLSELQEKSRRLTRLSEVLGRDELRSFVLSMVEENLIYQTNQELQRLCQGRYEIIHHNKGKGLTPEFYILDKFREGGRRKISTLSGGETFMVSLAMALGLAEMTRGQAEIDSLFIDEGFGTLDQESLEDVLEMLGQIQTRGLLVGVISHVKALTSALPVNLVLSKKSDGTSTVNLRFN